MKNIPFILLVLCLTSNFVSAQVTRNAKEASQNHKAKATNQAQLERDIKELSVFKNKVDQFENAFSNKNISRVAALKTDLLTDMQREISQSEKKIAQDKRELSQSKAEAASSNREVKRSRRDQVTSNGNGRNKRDDKRDKRDDVRDAQDDKNDLQQQRSRTTRQKEIYQAMYAFTFSFEPNLREKAIGNKALLKEFASTMEMDIAATKAEMVEDKRESKEDSRERREDRRGRGRN